MRRAVLVLLAAGLLAACDAASDDPAPTRAPPRGAPLAAAEQTVVRLPVPEEIVLPNGTRIWLLPDAEVPLVSVEVRVRGGSVLDDDAHAGRAALLAEMLRRGAGARDAAAFEEAIDEHGAAFSTGAWPRSFRISCEFLSEDVDMALGLVGDVLVAPRLDTDEFAIARGLLVDRLASSRDAPNAIIDTYWRAWLHPGDRAGVPSVGTETSLAALAAGDVRELWRSAFTGGGTIVAVAGAFDAATVRERAREVFGRLPSGAGAVVPAAANTIRAGGVLLVDKPDALQTYLRFGGMGVGWEHPSYPARLIANTILGARFTSRLNTALRIESGLTYGANSGFDEQRGGAFAVRTFTATEVSGDTLDLAQSVVAKFLADGLTAEELDSAKTYVMGQYAPENLETVAQRTDMLLDLDEFKLPRDHIEGLFARLEALTLDEVNAVVKRHFPPRPWAWVLIGQADVLRPLAADLGTVTEASLAAPGFGPR